MATSHTVTLIGREGCHLCDDARDVIRRVLDDIDVAVDLSEVSIDEDAALHEKYWDQIPVVLIDGNVHNFWRIDPVRLRSALIL